MTRRRRAGVEGVAPRSDAASGGASEVVRVWLLGGFRVSVADRVIGENEWRLRKARSLIKALSLAPGHDLLPEDLRED